MITILDYGAGNLRSVANTLAAIGAEFEVVRYGPSLERAQKIILPGVGHFGQMMRSLETLGVRQTLISRIDAGVPFLGICLGMQALFEGSEEAPELEGFGRYPGKILRFTGGARVPHMGWDDLELSPGSRLFRGAGPRPYVYFAHSYYARVIPATAATCTYTVPYTAALEDRNVFGVQFHPEKSGPTGLQIMRRFAEIQ
jgi:imidazole glycerol-phosphate synthase subunit HisH